MQFSLWSHGKSIDIVINQLEGDIRRTMYWLKINSLVANPDKFQFMILGTKRKANMKLEINDNYVFPLLQYTY